MGTVYVFNKQAINEAYLILSHGSLPLFRKLEFVGSVAFNLCMPARLTPRALQPAAAASYNAQTAR